jgi:hypothetical protein
VTPPVDPVAVKLANNIKYAEAGLSIIAAIVFFLLAFFI